MGAFLRVDFAHSGFSQSLDATETVLHELKMYLEDSESAVAGNSRGAQIKLSGGYVQLNGTRRLPVTGVNMETEQAHLARYQPLFR